MNISRDLALEIFELKEDFSEKDLDSAYRRLAKVSHPDTGGNNTLFRFINECKAVLEKNNYETAEKSKKQKPNNQSSNYNNKPMANISLDILYKDYYDLNYYTEQYAIQSIYTHAQIFIQPRFKRSLQEILKIRFSVPFKDFSDLNYKTVVYTDTIYFPDKFNKFKYFKVKIIVFNETFEFNISDNDLKNFSIDKLCFNTMFALSFRKNNKKED